MESYETKVKQNKFSFDRFMMSFKYWLINFLFIVSEPKKVGGKMLWVQSVCLNIQIHAV